MAVSKHVQTQLTNASWIRRMFEQGAQLKVEHGADQVFDFSLGNPDQEPPAAFRNALVDTVATLPPLAHRYMPNAGFPNTRAAIAARVETDHGVDPGSDGVVVSVGAAGALNVLLKSLLDPASEVIVLTPFFPEYRFYVDNHGGRVVEVPTTADFLPNLTLIEQALTPRTRAVIVNSPNNPSGRVYDQSLLDGLADLMASQAPEATLISDEPYRRILYEGSPGSVLTATPKSVVVSSFSKDLSLAGERLGYLAVHPEHPDRDRLVAASIFTNRTLGFVNAPALMQRVVAQVADASIDIGPYAQRRRVFLDGLRSAGYDCVAPEGAFYLFPATPDPDDVAFVSRLLSERILAVPGSGFGTPGHMRLSYAVPIDVIERSLEGFARARRG